MQAQMNAIKHSSQLTIEDLEPQTKVFKSLMIPAPTLQQYKEQPGYYVNFAPSTARPGVYHGPFDSQLTAIVRLTQMHWEVLRTN